MRVLVVNPGSSSVKLAVVADGAALESVTVDAASAEAARRPLAELAGRWAPIDAVGVRFVHGGGRADAEVVGPAEIERLRALTRLAPLHQPLSIALAELAGELVAAPVMACFDTAFHAGIPEYAAQYALPRDWVRRFGLRRYGFHGLSCAHALGRTGELLGVDPTGLRLICCHLGAGVSVTAIHDGRSVDTSMGFTPMEGAVMATRSGSVDPGLLLYLLETGVTDAAGLATALARESGLAGMTGTNGDLRQVLAAVRAGNADARLAVDVYGHRLRREIGAMAASLDRVDAVVFTGGVAEHQPALVANIVRGLPVLGLAVDDDRVAGSRDRLISPDGAATGVLVVTAREDLEIARQVTNVAVGAMGGGTGGGGPGKRGPRTAEPVPPRFLT